MRPEGWPPPFMMPRGRPEPVCGAGRREHAGIAQLGERQTEDLKVAGSIPAVGNIFFLFCFGRAQSR